MNIADIKEIKLSKSKIFRETLWWSAFFILGIWLLQIDSAKIIVMKRYNNPLYIHFIGLFGTVLASIMGYFCLRQLFDTKPGLILNSYGLVDNTGDITPGPIPWEDIVNFEVYEMKIKTKTLKLILIKVSNPQKYIEAGGFVKRWLKRENYKRCGSPVSITEGHLDIGFDELFNVCVTYLEKYGKSFHQSAQKNDLNWRTPIGMTNDESAKEK